MSAGELPLPTRAWAALRRERYLAFLEREYFLSAEERRELAELPRRTLHADLHRRVCEGLQTFVLERTQHAGHRLPLMHYKLPKCVMTLLSEHSSPAQAWLGEHVPDWQTTLQRHPNPSSGLMTMLAALEAAVPGAVAALPLTEQQRLMLMLPPGPGQSSTGQTAD